MNDRNAVELVIDEVSRVHIDRGVHDDGRDDRVTVAGWTGEGGRSRVAVKVTFRCSAPYGDGTTFRIAYTDCCCCTCPENGHSPMCRNHGFTGPDPCLTHELAGHPPEDRYEHPERHRHTGACGPDVDGCDAPHADLEPGATA